MNTKSAFRSALAGLALWAGFAAAAPFAYVPIGLENRVSVIDMATNNGVTSIPVGADPFGIAIHPSGSRVYVANANDGTLSVIDAKDNVVIRTIPVGSFPNGVAVNPSGTKVAVATTGSFTGLPTTIAVVETNTYTVTNVRVGARPVGVVFSPDGSRLYVSNLDDDNITVVNASTLAPIDSWAVAPAPQAMVINANGTRLYVAHFDRSISVMDTNTGRLLTNIPLSANADWLALSPDGSRLYLAKSTTDTLGVIDTGSNTVLFDVVLPSGSRPTGVSVHPDGTRIAVIYGGTSQLAELEPNGFSTVATIPLGAGSGAFGNFIGPVTINSGADVPGPLSGMWWNPSESGWGINFTQRHGNIFAAWYTYDGAGNPKWYVASNCSMPTGSNTCSGPLYQVTGPHFFGVPFDPSARVVTQVGSISVSYSGNDNAVMSYVVNGVGRTVTIQRQAFNSVTPSPFVNYTDLWWNSAEPGWGLAITQQSSVMFLAWYVYDDAGQPTWIVVPRCDVKTAGDGCVGDAYRTTGPPFGTSFDATQVRTFAAGKAFLNFTDPNNGQIDYIDSNLFVTKKITRQVF